MVDLLCALDFWRVVWEILVDLEVKFEAAALVHTLVGVNCEFEVENIVWVGEVRLHCRAEGQLFEILVRVSHAPITLRIPNIMYLFVCAVGPESPFSSCLTQQPQPRLAAAVSSVESLSVSDDAHKPHAQASFVYNRTIDHIFIISAVLYGVTGYCL